MAAYYVYVRWKDVLERTVSELDREIAALSESKDALEKALEAKNLPTEVNMENLVTREGRRDIDVVEDEVEDQLQKVCVIKISVRVYRKILLLDGQLSDVHHRSSVSGIFRNLQRGDWGGYISGIIWQ